MKVAAFLVTKDRACQAEACLRSMYENIDFIDTTFVQYKYSYGNYKKAYDKLVTSVRRGNFELWVPENEDFRSCFLSFLKFISEKYDYVLGITDDTYFYRKFRLQKDEIPSIFYPSDWSLSLRLGLNTKIQNPDNGSPMGTCDWTSKTTLLNGETFYAWNFKKESTENNWGYPISLDGCLYYAKNLYEASKSIEFSNLREWEGNLLGYKNPLDWMICPEESVAVNIDSNLTQNTGKSRSPYPVSLEELNNKFLDGWVIDLDNMFKDVIVEGSHQYLPLLFKKER